MLSCTPKNKSACASSDEGRCRILRGSDRSAESGLAPNCLGQIMSESYERPSLPPASAQSCSTSEPSFVNPLVTSNLEMFVGVAKKPQHLDAPIATKPSCRSYCALEGEDLRREVFSCPIAEMRR
jgi:hypothetical protein